MPVAIGGVFEYFEAEQRVGRYRRLKRCAALMADNR